MLWHCRGKQEDAEAAQAGLPPDVPLVLLAVEPSTFRQMLFFKKSLTDHLPLTYLRVRGEDSASRGGREERLQRAGVVEVFSVRHSQ